MSAAPTSTSPRQPWADWLLVGLLAVLMWLPTVDFFTGIDITRQPNENRQPAPIPRLTHLNFAGLQEYVTASELYFNDHFGFRKRLIRWFQQWTWRLFRQQNEGRTEGRSLVYSGQHGWLFFAGQQMMENYMGTDPFTPRQLRAWQKLLEKRRDWLAARGIQYYFVVPPDKHNIYSEELPLWLQKATPAKRETKLDQFERYMQQHSTVRIVDLRQPLLAAKTNAPTYLKNDTHWNAYGAFVGCQTLLQTMARDFPDLPPLRMEDFIWSNVPPAVSGDLNRLLGTEFPEATKVALTPKPSFPAPQLTLITNLVLLWKMDNTNATDAISENSAPLKETAVVFHDSFGNAWRPYLGGSFKRVLYVWDNREFNPQIIAENHPQIVISEMLERFFDTFNPEDFMAKEALP